MQFSGVVQICEGFNIELTYFLKTLSLTRSIYLFQIILCINFEINKIYTNTFKKFIF